MRSRIIRRVTAAATLFTCIIVLQSSCKKSDQAASANRGGAASAAPRAVSVGKTERRQLTRTVIAPGTLAADEEATVSFKVAGRLERINIDLGSMVKKGQSIAFLETNDFKVRLQQAEAALQQARVRLGLPAVGENDQVAIENTAIARQAAAVLEEAGQNRERTRQLVKQGIQSTAELDRVESAFKVADSRYQDAIEEARNRQAVLLQRRSELAIARQQLVETTLMTPFVGAVRERRASIGEYLTAGTPVATIVRLHPLRLRVEVPERDARGIRPGQSVGVTVEGDVTRYSGRIARLSPAFQEQSRTLIIEAEVDNQQGRLRPGSFARAEIETTTTDDVVMAPLSAIVTFAGIQKVFLVRDGKSLERNVVTSRTQGEWIVVEGVDADSTVILNPGNLTTGQQVTVNK